MLRKAGGLTASPLSLSDTRRQRWRPLPEDTFHNPPSLPHPPRTVRAVMEVTGSVQKSARLLHHAGLRNCRLLFCKHFVVNYITACCVLNYCKVAVSRDFLAIIFLLNGSTCALYEFFLFRFREIFLFRKDIRILS